jgi:hypothetical protein
VIELGRNRYGKAAIDLGRVARHPSGHRARDLVVTIVLEGDFTAARAAMAAHRGVAACARSLTYLGVRYRSWAPSAATGLAALWVPR